MVGKTTKDAFYADYVCSIFCLTAAGLIFVLGQFFMVVDLHTATSE